MDQDELPGEVPSAPLHGVIGFTTPVGLSTTRPAGSVEPKEGLVNCAPFGLVIVRVSSGPGEVPCATAVGLNVQLRVGGATLPLPSRLIATFELGELASMMSSVALRAPLFWGTNMRFRVQFAAGGMDTAEGPPRGAPEAFEPMPHQCAELGGGPPVVST